MPRKLPLMLIAIVLALAMAGCGDDPFADLQGDLTEPTATTEFPTVPSETTVPAEVATTPEAETTPDETSTVPEGVTIGQTTIGPNGIPIVHFVVVPSTGGRGNFEQPDMVTDLGGKDSRKVVIKLENQDDSFHNLVIETPDGKTFRTKKAVGPAATIGFKMILTAGEKYKFYSDYKDDREYAMEGNLKVN